MKEESKQKRHAQIANCAYDVLGTSGYSGASLLTIAKAAKASNETLYRWYGGKLGLFEAMIRDNAAETRERLEAAIGSEADPMQTLKAIAPVLLGMVLGEKAVLLNRAAAADPSNELGKAIARNGRDSLAPLIGNVMARLSTGSGYSHHEMTDMFISLLIGDLQVRRAIGAMSEPDASYTEARANTAIDRFISIIGQPVSSTAAKS
ncbi:TetR/AcrR family transcriptional regulator [Paracoccus albus]|uniref:TetR/AcrR family transcriptional regulator n=1 Tax=Paracoccus albus TaxID=3017784 RepID=UPI0022F0E15C|nr:TetR/AcrR family transcriptional regulator [Paracoccus albus]WBU59008.1 TetR/AcrR family transcriptional regulator [Paracoccus albus]